MLKQLLKNIKYKILIEFFYELLYFIFVIDNSLKHKYYGNKRKQNAMAY